MIRQYYGSKNTGNGFIRYGVRLLPKTTPFLLLLSVIGVASQVAAQSSSQQQQAATPAEWKAVEQAIGKSGAMQPGNVFKFSFPRSDLNVTARGVQIKPALALGSWVAFKKMGDQAMVMGDLVLTEDEVSPVMMKLQQEGVEQTALHNHVLNESPRVMYMHIGAHGDAEKIARSIRTALALTKTPFGAPASPAPAQDLGIDTKHLDQIIGHGGKANGGVYQFSVPRAEKIMESGME